MGNSVVLIYLAVFAIFVFGLIIAVFSRYKKCPSDRILVKYGKISKSDEGDSRSAKCIHGGAAFIWPVFQAYAFLDLTPISIEVNLTNALSKQNIRVDVPSRFTVGISTEKGVMQNAAERLLSLKLDEIQELAKDIIFGQLRLVVATMDIEEINTDRDKFLSAVSNNVETELKKIGLRLINVNVTDINDESGYIVALGKEAAAKAINDAKVSVAEKNKDGSIGEALAQKDQRIQVAEADALAVEGENLTKITIANSEAVRREQQAKANRIAVAAENIQEAEALEESYAAEEIAEIARGKKETATRKANEIVVASINKEKIEIAADAEAEKTRRHAKGEADAIYLKMAAQANGINEILMKQAEGFEAVVKASGGGVDDAVKLMLADKMTELASIQVEAIKNIKIDKITVWDSMSNGTPSTANFLSGMMKSVPPMNEMFKMAGMDLPKFLGSDFEKNIDESEIKVDKNNIIE